MRGKLFILIFSLFCSDAAIAQFFGPSNCGSELRRVYREKFNQILQMDASAKSRAWIDRIQSQTQYHPSSSYLTDLGSFAKKFQLEIEMNLAFLLHYNSWKQELTKSGLFSLNEIEEMDLSFYIRALVWFGPFDPHEIFNLSLIVDNIYGAHLYRTFKSNEIRDMGDFLRLRRKLAMVQSNYIAHISQERSWKNREKLSPAERLSQQNQAVKLPLDPRVKAVAWMADLGSKLFPPLSRFTTDVLDGIQPAGPIEPIGTELAKFYLEQDWTLSAMKKFDAELGFLSDRLRQEEAIPGNENVFDLALRSVDQDAEKALILVGLLSIQRKALIRRLSLHYAEAGVLSQYAEALSLSTSLYYRITETAELVEMKRPTTAKHYSFLYPGGISFANNKFYHFWSEAFFSYYLRQLKHPRLLVHCGISAVGCVYELATSYNGIQLYRAFSLGLFESLRQIRLLEDIRLHFKGAQWGLKLFEQLKSTNQKGEL